ncbi:alpha-amylase family glycosyl hydrolase [Marinobacter qingdaonensis]|uniref:Alpha-amylase family glycosyl hydrolase n=1 Tax=Marinobacter qingdaonensis TaxID=3108486 RepID=A0ABU5P1Y7_9GAMM|nr:alpha-amylase family glycosyl hydrolase [Marinobacter sp. ASW11-75]MEA1082070.1 alpha-amylase family glycosyl hydrolase [Marinobacter sp. ASW11-75]
MNQSQPWWKGGIIYQIYPRSFLDTTGDGIGDLQGITERLSYVASLGVDAIWLSPFFTSPMKDFGYDVSDYRGVDPIFGNLDDYRALVAEAHRLGLKVIIDQVLSHTADSHPWFAESRTSRDNPKSDWYVWADPKPDGNPPNNWLSIFGGSAWAWDSRRGQYYLHNFLTSQPDLNFHNPEVRQAQLDNMRFWLDLGADGFRLDTVNFYYHSQGLENNPAVREGDSKTFVANSINPYTYQRHVYDLSQPENLAFLGELRSLMDEYPDTTLVGEIGDDNPLQRMAEYTQGNKRLHMAYSFDLLSDRQGPEWVRDVVRRFQNGLAGGWPCWALSNHDVVRVVSRWGQGVDDPKALARILMALLLSLRGSVSIYQGEELGLPEAEVPFEALQDPYGIEFWPEFKGRDGCRTPMPWTADQNGGFTSGSTPWLPVDRRHLEMAVAVQEEDSESTLNQVRRLIRWRQQQPALVGGDLSLIEDTGDALCWVRRTEDQAIFVALNVTGTELRLPAPVSIRRAFGEPGFQGRIEDGDLVLPPYQALFGEL